MARRRVPSLDATQDALVASGLQPDRHALKRILWEKAANVIFEQASVRRKYPSQAFAFPNGLPVRGIAQQQMVNGTKRLWAAAGTDLAYWSFGAPTIVPSQMPTYIEDATATQAPTFYDLTPFGDWMIVNNSKDTPRIFKNDADYNTYTDAPVGAARFMKYLNMMLAIGYGTHGTQVGWTHPDDIFVWTADENNRAGSMTFDEMNTRINAGARIGNAVAVYAEDQMGLMTYIGEPFMFSQRTLIDGIGAIGKMAVAADGRINVGVSRSGIWWTDGNSARYIDEGFISDYLQDNVNWLQGAKIIAARNDYTGCFEFHFPMLGSDDINEAWSWDPKSGGWSPTVPASIMDERRLFQYPLHGLNNGQVHLTDYNKTGATNLLLESKALVMQDQESPHKVVRMDEIDLFLHKAAKLEFRVGCCDEPNGTFTWTSWMGCEAGAKAYHIPSQEVYEAPFWKVAFRNIPGQFDWDINLQGFIMYSWSAGVK